MESFQLKRTDAAVLAFEGVMLEKVSTPKYETSDGVRGYALSLYAKEGGGYVVSVEYSTNFATETSVVFSEEVDEPKDVENFFLVFEPCEFVDHDMLQALSEDQRMQMRKAMCRIYDGHVDTVLQALQNHLAQQKDTEQPREAENKEGSKKRMLNFFGLK